MENPHIPDAILGTWLYLGSKHTRERRDILDELNVKCVMDFSQLEGLEKFEHIEYVLYDVVDNETAAIAKFFEGAHELMRKHLAQQSVVFVHCNQGRSRSATIILSYLMKYENMNLKQAWLYVKERRRIVMPNAGFLRQLIEYETKVLSLPPSLQIGRHGQLHCMVRHFYGDRH